MKSLFALLVLTFIVLSHCSSSSNKVLLKDVQTLTFQKGQYTTGRRSSPVLQLNCVGGSAKSKSYTVENVQCRNTGLDDRNEPNWKCQSTLDKSLKLGKVEVSCEGYDYPDDKYILKGSCSLEYNLEHNSDYITVIQPPKQIQKEVRYTTVTYDPISDIFSGFFIVLIVLVFIACCVSCCYSQTPPYRSRNRPFMNAEDGIALQNRNSESSSRTYRQSTYTPVPSAPSVQYTEQVYQPVQPVQFVQPAYQPVQPIVVSSYPTTVYNTPIVNPGFVDGFVTGAVLAQQPKTHTHTETTIIKTVPEQSSSSQPINSDKQVSESFGTTKRR